MMHIHEGDRIRINPGTITDGEHTEGLFGTVTEVKGDDSIIVDLEQGETVTVAPGAAEPCPPLPPVLRDREIETANNIWGPDLPRDLGLLDSDVLWEMYHRTSEAIEESYQDDDMEAMGVLCPLNVRVTQELSRRSQ